MSLAAESKVKKYNTFIPDIVELKIAYFPAQKTPFRYQFYFHSNVHVWSPEPIKQLVFNQIGLNEIQKILRFYLFLFLHNIKRVNNLTTYQQ